MAILPIDEVTAGSILARPVEDSVGRILINAGEELTEQLLNVLRKRGFVEIEVRPDNPRRDTEAMERRLTGSVSEAVQYDKDVVLVKQDIERRFHNVADNHKPMQIVRLVVQKVMVERLARAKGLV